MSAVLEPHRRQLGLGLATALVGGNMIGSGVFLLPSALAKYGGLSILAFSLTAVGALLLALVFARLGRAWPRTGGPYAYSRNAFGDYILPPDTVPADLIPTDAIVMGTSPTPEPSTPARA